MDPTTRAQETGGAEARTVFETSALDAGYPGATVVRDVSWKVRAGEFWFVVGPNGSGKSTLLRTVLGDLRPRAGRVDRSPDLARREVTGFVPQASEPRPSVRTTVREFVALGQVGVRATRRERADALRDALAATGLEALARAELHALSGGQRRKALVARALARAPSLLIADEPTAGLDLPSTESLLDSLETLHRERGLTIVFVIHDVAAALRHGTHVALCAGGRVTTGPASDVVTAATLERAYGVPVDVSSDGSGAIVLRVRRATGSRS